MAFISYFLCFYFCVLIVSAKNDANVSTISKYPTAERNLGVLDLLYLAQRRFPASAISNPTILGAAVAQTVSQSVPYNAMQNLSTDLLRNYDSVNSNMLGNNNLNTNFYAKNSYNNFPISGDVRTLEVITDPNKRTFGQNFALNSLKNNVAFTTIDNNFSNKPELNGNSFNANNNNLNANNFISQKYNNGNNVGLPGSVHQKYELDNYVANKSNGNQPYLNYGNAMGDTISNDNSMSGSNAHHFINEKIMNTAIGEKNDSNINEIKKQIEIDNTKGKVSETSFEMNKTDSFSSSNSEVGTSSAGTVQNTAIDTEAEPTTKISGTSAIEVTVINPQSAEVATGMSAASEKMDAADKSAVGQTATIPNNLPAASEAFGNAIAIDDSSSNTAYIQQKSHNGNNGYASQPYGNNNSLSSNKNSYGYNNIAQDNNDKFDDSSIRNMYIQNVVSNNGNVLPHMYDNVAIGGSVLKPTSAPIYIGQAAFPSNAQTVNSGLLGVNNQLQDSAMFTGVQDFNSIIYNGSKKFTSFLNDFSSYRQQNKDDTLVQFLDKIEEVTKTVGDDSGVKKDIVTPDSSKTKSNIGGGNNRNPFDFSAIEKVLPEEVKQQIDPAQEHQLQAISSVLGSGFDMALNFLGAQQRNNMANGNSLTQNQQQFYNTAINSRLNGANNNNIFNNEATQQPYNQQQQQYQFNQNQQFNHPPQLNQQQQFNQQLYTQPMHYNLDQAGQVLQQQDRAILQYPVQQHNRGAQIVPQLLPQQQLQIQQAQQQYKAFQGAQQMPYRQVQQVPKTTLAQVHDQNMQQSNQQLQHQQIGLSGRRLQDSYLEDEVDSSRGSHPIPLPLQQRATIPEQQPQLTIRQPIMQYSTQQEQQMYYPPQQQQNYNLQPNVQYQQQQNNVQKHQLTLQSCFRENVKLEGNRLFVTSSYSLESCQAQCQGILVCQFFYFRSQEKMCYMYGDFTELIIDQGSTSGPKFCPINTQNGFSNQITQPVINSNSNGALLGMQTGNYGNAGNYGQADNYGNAGNYVNGGNNIVNGLGPLGQQTGKLQQTNNLLGLLDTVGTSSTVPNQLISMAADPSMIGQQLGGGLGSGLQAAGLLGGINSAGDFFRTSQALMEASSTFMNAFPITQLWQAGQSLSGNGFFRNKGITAFNGGLEKQNTAPPPGVGIPSVTCAAEGMTCCVPEKAVSDWKSKPPYLNGQNNNPTCRAHFVSIQNSLCVTTSYEDELCDIVKTETEDFIIYHHTLTIPSRIMNNAICECRIPKEENDEGLKQIEGFSTWEFSKQALTAAEEQSKMGEKLVKGLGTAMAFGNMINQQGSQAMNDIENVMHNKGSGGNPTRGNFFNGISSMVDAIADATVAANAGNGGTMDGLNAQSYNSNGGGLAGSKGSSDMSPQRGRTINQGNGGVSGNDLLGSFVHAGDIIKNNSRTGQRKQQFGLQ